MAAVRIGGGRDEAGLIGLAGLHAGGDGGVDFEVYAFVVVVAVENGLGGGLHFGDFCSIIHLREARRAVVAGECGERGG